MQGRFFRRFLTAAAAAVLFFSSCTRVSEDSEDTPQVILPSFGADAGAEITEFPEMSEISASISQISDADSTSAESESEASDRSEETSPENPEMVLGVSEKSGASAETKKKKSETTTQKTEKATQMSDTSTQYVGVTMQNTQPETQNADTAERTYTETSKVTLQQESPPETTAEKSPGSYNQNSYKAMNYKEQKGFWITYLEYGSILKNKSKSSFTKSIGQYFDNISSLGFNTVYVQVRAFGDAYYDSALYPSGEQFTGTIGTSSSFDALQVMIDCAHERGLSLHAWVNPMRLMYPSQIKSIDSSYPIKKWYDDRSLNGKYIVESGGRLYLNPAYEDVTDLIASGIAEIVSGYDVDGIQIDDYFYPTTASSFDSAAYSASGTSLSLSKWRTDNVNRMVRKLYDTVHRSNSSAYFGISPQGSVDNNYNELYADVRKWCSESGYCDYILPQVYFGFNSVLPYADVASQWNNMVSGSGVKLVIGLAAYKIGAADSYAGSAGKNEWISNSDIISRQMEYAKSLTNYGGVALYRYDSLFNPASDVSAQVSKEMKNIPK